jgi:peptidoglycan/xylan/chitin deacetylase (PgdA/CDA1 family)
MASGSGVLGALRRRWLLILVAVPLFLAILWFAGSFIPIGGNPVTHGPATQQMIALTFDDGPNAIYTPEVLQILDSYQAKGTFFLIGANVKRHPEIARLIIEHGQQIGNHSYLHSNFLPYLLPNQIVDDYRKAEKAIREATGLEPRFYRAPHGRLSPWMRWDLRRQGLILAGWNDSAGDWKNPGVEELVKRIVGAARPGGIIDLHDGLDRNESPDLSQLVQALPTIIEQLQSRGYRLVTLAQLLGKEPYF